ncbi:MAG: hypothetical protein ACKVSF_03355 [Alphaproteobacteria bacterium]
MTRQETEQSIARDLEMCDLGEALTKGKLRLKYRRHRLACMAEIKRMNSEDGLDRMTDDEILSAIMGS